jgi:hypothetical protein
MNIKQIILTLIVLFTINSLGISQVKKQYQDKVHKSTTVVIKEDGANDLDILNTQFNLDDYAVNEQIKITTDHSTSPIGTTSQNVSGGQSTNPPAPELTSATASTTNTFERPKTKMKRWSVREKKETTNSNEVVKEKVEENQVVAAPSTVKEKSLLSKNVSNNRTATTKKYKKKSIKKKRIKRLKKQKRKKRSNRNGKCYKF